MLKSALPKCASFTIDTIYVLVPLCSHIFGPRLTHRAVGQDIFEHTHLSTTVLTASIPCVPHPHTITDDEEEEDDEEEDGGDAAEEPAAKKPKL